jgi:hypothetical protein
VVDPQEVERILNHIGSQATGPDGINIKMIMYCMPLLLPHLTYLINRCLSSNKFPKQWKNANVIPVPKISQPTDISHYRPISILPTLSKVLEKIVDRQFGNFLAEGNILPSTQSGFRSNHSTTTALLKVTDDILCASDKGQNTCLILLDYSKAFDTLDHKLLFTKLLYFGVGNDALDFFKSYFSGRSQRVCFRDSFSSYLPVVKGVAQGSIIGPMMFSLYTSDFSSLIKHCSSHQYADDTQLYLSFPYSDIETAFNKINSDLQILSSVSQAHGLLLNENKTKLLIFGKDKLRVINNRLLNISINNTIIEPVDSCKNLGLFLDNNLRFESHVSSLIQKSFGKLRSLYIHKDILDTSIKLKLTDSLILSNISYCCSVYWPALIQKDKTSLQRVQNACLRYAYNVRKFDHITESLKKSKWLNLEERYQTQLLVLVKKVMLLN